MRARTTVLVGGVLIAGLLGGCSPEEPPPSAQALQPRLDLGERAPRDSIRIGVLVPPVEGAGAEFRPLVEGARVAAYRFELGGADVEFSVALDDGTEEGARAAMESLIDQDVVGVVLASAATTATEALQVAHEADTAVIMPYGQSDDVSAWSVAPSRTAILSEVKSALDDEAATRPYLAVAEGRALDLTAARTAALGDAESVAAEIVTMLEAREIDSVVIDGPASLQAALVVALQGRLGSRQLPIILTPEAQTPLFGDLLDESGTTAGRLLSIGTDTGDHVALRESEAGTHEAVFFAAIRLAVGDVSCENIYGDDACAAGVSRADVASHDATVALIRAVEAAGSVEPAQVRVALSGLGLGHEDGLVGPTLDFTESQALADEDVVLVHASTSDPGLRPVDSAGRAAASLFWFTGSTS